MFQKITPILFLILISQIFANKNPLNKNGNRHPFETEVFFGYSIFSNSGDLNWEEGYSEKLNWPTFLGGYRIGKHINKSVLVSHDGFLQQAGKLAYREDLSGPIYTSPTHYLARVGINLELNYYNIENDRLGILFGPFAGNAFYSGIRDKFNLEIGWQIGAFYFLKFGTNYMPIRIAFQGNFDEFGLYAFDDPVNMSVGFVLP